MITIDDFKIKHTNKVRFIGLDLGSKRIGVSICDERQSIATPFKTINKTNTNELIDELKIIIKDNNIGGIIIGNPLNMDGTVGRSAQSVNDVASNISKLSRISVDDVKADKLVGDLNSIFDFIEKLNELNTDNVEPLTSVAETTLKLRADEVKSENIRDQILKNSPEENEDFFVVPRVVE